MEKTRQELFELVWSMPMTKLSKQFELSDVGLRKICVKHQIPLPLRFRQQKLKSRCKSTAFFIPDQIFVTGTRTGTRLSFTEQPSY